MSTTTSSSSSSVLADRDDVLLIAKLLDIPHTLGFNPGFVNPPTPRK